MKVAVPEAITDQNHRWAARTIFVLCEGSAVNCCGSEQGKEAGTSLGFLNLLRQIARFVVGDSESPSGYVLEGLGLGIPKVELHR